MILSNKAVLQVQQLTREAQVLCRGTQSQQKEADVILARIKSIRDTGLSEDESRAKYTMALGESITGQVSEERMRQEHEAAFRDYMSTGEHRDFQAGTQMISYTNGSGGGFLVPVSFFYKAIEALAQTDPIFDEKIVTLIKNPALTANPIKVSGWDLSGIASSQVGESLQQTPQTIPLLSGKVLGGYMHRISLAASLEWEQDVFDMAMNLMSRTYGVGFARGIGKQLVNGTGSSQPQGLLTGAANSGYTTITASSGGLTPLKLDDFNAIYTSVDRIYRQSPKCAWLMSDTTYRQVRQAQDSQGRPLLDQSQDKEEILSKPVIISPSMPSGPGSTGIIFGDLSHFFVRLSGMTIQRSLEVGGTAGNIEHGEATYHGRLRADSAVFDPSTPQGSPAVTHPPIVYATLHA
jgi:HK97 family phage major capsid protein